MIITVFAIREGVEAIRAVTAAAFRGAEHSAPPVEPDGDPGEATLVSWRRADPGWIPGLSLAAVEDDEIIGHVVATRAQIGSSPALGLGPVSVVPQRQGTGVGSVLTHTALGVADVRGETARVEYFRSFVLSSYNGQRGAFKYAYPFEWF